MPYSNRDFKETNINYVDRDFSSLKESLIKYAQSYFPTTYRDFNDTSPGMMLIEMAAYVGDVLNFYIDQQYKEMMLPLAEERRNVLNIAKMLGYKTKPIVPAHATLVIQQSVPADGTDPNNIVPKLNEAIIIDKGFKIKSDINPDIIFETLDVCDFTYSSSLTEAPIISAVNPSNGLATEYTLTRRVKAISSMTKQYSFNIGAPTKFLKLTLPDTDVTEIIACTDSNGNRWYEVDFLAQDKVPLETMYLEDLSRHNAYSDVGQINESNITNLTPVPYNLEYIKTSKRFITEVDDRNKTSLVFGNGVLKNGQSDLESGFLQSMQAGFTFAGQSNELTNQISPTLGDSTKTLGETPNQTTLTVSYRVGGGVSKNVPAGVLTSYDNVPYLGGTTLGSNILSVNNRVPASGGAKSETIAEIRERAKSNFATQLRCVTKEDYEARVLSMPPKFGHIPKVYVERVNVGEYPGGDVPYLDTSSQQVLKINKILATFNNFLSFVLGNPSQVNEYLRQENPNNNNLELLLFNLGQDNVGQWGGDGDFSSFDFNGDGILNPNDVTTIEHGLQLSLGTIKIHVLGYDNQENLFGDPWHGTEYCLNCNGRKLPNLIKQNLKTYLDQYRIITDEISIQDGYIINFGVYFDVTAHKNAIKQDVKIRCIDIISNYFNIDKMQFRQPIYTTDLEYELMNVDGVRSVNYVVLSQDKDWVGNPHSSGNLFGQPLIGTWMEEGVANGTNGRSTYGYAYDFSRFYKYTNLDGTPNQPIAGDGVILPSVSPSVFELKNPKQNIKGVVR